MPDYKLDKEKCIDFLQNYVPDGEDKPKYLPLLQDIANRARRKLDIALDDVEAYQKDEELLAAIETNAKRYISIFAEAADEIMPPATSKEVPDDIFDVLAKANKDATEGERAQGDAPGAAAQQPGHGLPPQLLRRYQVLLAPRSRQAPLKMRAVQAEHVGALVTLKGIVTHVTDVKPLITVATYLDPESGGEVYQEVTGREFMPLAAPPRTVAGQSVAAQPLQLETRGCKCVAFQEIKLQELGTEVPQGATPRSVSVHIRGELTRTVKPGDLVTLTGIFLTAPFTGFRAMRAGLLTSTYIEAQHVVQAKQSYSEMSLSEEDLAQIEELDKDGDIYGRLARSIAPEIWGHEDVKKALLLLMVGGVTRHLPDGMKLRGDIHICLMGDPGVAKSQLLKHIAHVSPRAVYTTGKGSSGVGLTAAVQRDQVTGEMVLEGGALVLADKGICCIDEFDKMDETDRTAIHEVMEQQTVSIAKAGITTTLNTRTTLLAAANPAWGRYDTRRSPQENIALPAALLSRFDLMWLLLDRSDAENDRELATHVLTVHKEGRAPSRASGQDVLPPRLLRAYVAEAKKYEPCIPEHLADYMAAVYADMRREEAEAKTPHSYTTARTLLSILRLSQALARLRFSDAVIQADVDEALRLMKMSKVTLLENEARNRPADPVTEIYCRVRDAAVARKQAQFTLTDVQRLCGPSFSLEQIKACLEEYQNVDIWQLEYDNQGQPSAVIFDAWQIGADAADAMVE